MRNIRRRRTRARNRNPQKNQRSQNTPIRNEFEPSDQRFWAEGSDKGLSTQHLRPNLEPIYHRVLRRMRSATSMAEKCAMAPRRLHPGFAPDADCNFERMQIIEIESSDCTWFLARMK